MWRSKEKTVDFSGVGVRVDVKVQDTICDCFNVGVGGRQRHQEKDKGWETGWWGRRRGRRRERERERVKRSV